MRESGYFFGGLLLGAILSAVCGFDVFPAREPYNAPPPAAGGAAQPIRPAGGEAIAAGADLAAGALPGGSPSGGSPSGGAPRGDSPEGVRAPLGPDLLVAAASPGGTLPATVGPEADGPPPLEEAEARAQADALAEALAAGAWCEAAAPLERLLTAGEAGQRRIIEAIRRAAPSGSEWQEAELPYCLTRLAVRREADVEDLVSAAVTSEAMAESGFARLVYRLAPPFAASLEDESSGARGVLAQKLLADLEEGRRENLWWTLRGLETLGLAPGTETLSRLLLDPRAQDSAGTIVLQLARMGTPEAAAALAAYIEVGADALDPPRVAALRELAQLELPEAQAALRRLLEKGRRDLREAAGLAFFSRPRPRGDAPLAAGLLDSDIPAGGKRRLAAAFKRHSPEISAALLAEPSPLRTVEARDAVQRAELPPPAKE